jgi:hypothetical protein
MVMRRIVFPYEEFLIRNIPDGMAEDFINAGILSLDKINSLTRELKQAEGFLSPRQLGIIIKKILSKKEEADAVYRVLKNISSFDLDTWLERIDEWRKQEDEHIKRLPDELFDQVKDGLRELIGSYPALERFRKAERLEDITGKSLEEVEIICDLRPIFDEKREKVEGMIPYTRLKLIVENEDGSSEAIEAELSAKQVMELAKKSQMAQTKLACLRSQINKWIPGGMPDVERARKPQTKENGDG